MSESTTRNIEQARLEIAILLYDGMTALDTVGPYEVFSRLPDATIKFVAKQKGLIRTDTRFLALNADYLLSEVTSPDVILIPGGSAGTKKIAEELPVLDWIRQTHVSSKWTTAVCTGTLLLREAELLAGIEASTHWGSAS